MVDTNDNDYYNVIIKGSPGVECKAGMVPLVNCNPEEKSRGGIADDGVKAGL
jgi:hypothetical protein